MPVQFPNKVWEKVSLADMVYESIRHAVVHGSVRPWARLNQIALAKEFGVSERTVREALTRLVSEGLVRREPYKEFRVVGLSALEIEEIFYMRALLEGWAMELAACRISAEEVARMRMLLPQMETSINLESVLRLQETNREFHWIAINAAGKTYLLQMLNRLWDLTLPYAFADEDMESYMQQTQEDQVYHPQLVDALEAGDAKKARDIDVKHIYKAMAFVQFRVKQLNDIKE